MSIFSISGPLRKITSRFANACRESLLRKNLLPHPNAETEGEHSHEDSENGFSGIDCGGGDARHGWVHCRFAFAAAVVLDTRAVGACLPPHHRRAGQRTHRFGDPAILLDVRTPAEFAEKHIPGALLIPNETIGDTPPPELTDLNAEILIYCRSGSRSRQAAEKLIAMGYTAVYDFGGIASWPYETVKG
jgi:rhodanese-related sulfurtransferase